MMHMRADLIPTIDPRIFIEERRDGYVRYRRSDGLRWEVHGYCIRLGNCLIGAVIQTPDGPVQVTSHEHIKQLQANLGRERIDSELDVPVGVGFTGCCSLVVREL
jgi:hypothetical protein